MSLKKKIYRFISKNKTELFLIFLINSLFFLPALTGLKPLLFDDAAYISFPRICGMIKSFQNLEFPLWDSHTFIGARPYYTMLDTPIFYPFIYPFVLLLFKSKSLDTWYFFSYLIPFYFHLLFASYGMYIFLRKTFKLKPKSSLTGAILFSISPSFAASFTSLTVTFTIAWLPWVIFIIHRAIKRFTYWRFFCGAFSVFILTSTGDLNFVIRAYVASFIVLTTICISRYKKYVFIKKFLIISLIYLFGILLSAGILTGFYEGVTWMPKEKSENFDIKSLSCVHPNYLLTIFIPDFYGMVNGNEAWNKGLEINHDGIIQGGIIASMMILIIPLGLFLKKSKLKKIFLYKNISFLILFITFLNVHTGYHSSLFKILCKVFPPAFKIPHPVYYLFFLIFIFSTLCASGIELFFSSKIYKNRFFKTSFFAFITSVLIFFSISCLLSKETSLFYSKLGKNSVKICFNSFVSMINLDESKNFLLKIINFFIFFAFSTLTIIYFNKEKKLKKLIISLIILETIFYNYSYMYTHTMNPRLNTKDNSNYEKMFMKRFSWPSNHPYFNQNNKLSALINDNYRYTSSITDLDNISWFLNCKALCGYDSKPIIPAFREILEKYYNGWTYQLWTDKLPINFLKNLSVGHFLSIKGITNIIDKKNGFLRFLDETKIQMLSYHRKTDPPYWLAESHDYSVFSLDEPIPLIYFQTKIKKKSKIEQLKHLLMGDFKNFTAVDKKFYTKIKNKNKNQIANNFNNVKKPIFPEKIYMKNNSIKIIINNNENGILNINQIWHEGWKAFVNNNPVKVHRVNYLMQGIALSPGKNIIKLKFFPTSVKHGLYISFFTFLFLIFLILYEKRKKLTEALC